MPINVGQDKLVRVRRRDRPYVNAVSRGRFDAARMTAVSRAEQHGGDANPASKICDLLVSPSVEIGLGLLQGFLEFEAFSSVGQTLATKSLGLSMLV